MPGAALTPNCSRFTLNAPRSKTFPPARDVRRWLTAGTG
ncbi:hypothetical protein T05_12627 [Trichinella murrelli]|uniref:Uncharacterized protein n=1 Tax=Trichinella murrelli TaxID=144512 RepID=A0A0V0SX78_9BILA|nr:hypothetical protein T05_12627 [Trichinella murrelli]